MKIKSYILKKDLPSIRAGRIFKLSSGGRFIFPSLFSSEDELMGMYEFEIQTVINNPDFFEEFEYDNSKQPEMYNPNK